MGDIFTVVAAKWRFGFEFHMLAQKLNRRLLRSITEEGAAALAEVVDRSHLKELNIYMNDIGDGGALKARWHCTGFRVHGQQGTLDVVAAVSDVPLAMRAMHGTGCVCAARRHHPAVADVRQRHQPAGHL